MTSLFPIKAFLLISLKTDIVNRNYVNEILASMSSKTTSKSKIKVAVTMAIKDDHSSSSF